MVVTKDQVIPARCEGIIIARLESPLGVENGLVEPSPQANPPEGIYIARTLFKDRQEVPFRVLNAIHRDHKLTRGSPLARCEPVMLVTPPDVGQPQAQDSSSKLEDVIEAAKPHLTNGEFRELEELLTEYEDIFVGDNEDYVRTNKVHHRIDTGDARPIRQSLERIPLVKKRRYIRSLTICNAAELSRNQTAPGRPPSFWSERRMGNSVQQKTEGRHKESLFSTAPD
jgi:hypothetical protein